jgi:hypothetical protein
MGDFRVVSVLLGYQIWGQELTGIGEGITFILFANTVVVLT